MSFVARRRDRPSEASLSVVGLLDKTGAQINPATEDTLNSRLDVALTTLARLERWGRDVEPAWIYGNEVTAPTAGSALVSKAVSTERTGYVYGIFISAQEANDFKLNWTSRGTAYSIRIVFAGKGTLVATFEKAINEGLGADANSSITITNVNAGSAGVVYQAGILYAEV